MKTYVITISARFPSYHPRLGEPTGFKEGFIEGRKKHTIRDNYALWKKRVDAINAGEAKLSVRGWIGKPYASKQYIIRELFAGEVGIQKASVTKSENPRSLFPLDITIDEENKNSIYAVIAQNDGLTINDFESWFKEPIKDGAIIHFTNLRY